VTIKTTTRLIAEQSPNLNRRKRLDFTPNIDTKRNFGFKNQKAIEA
jgi:hypothetical protein